VYGFVLLALLMNIVLTVLSFFLIISSYSALVLMSIILTVLLSFCLIVSRCTLYYNVCLSNVHIHVLSVCICNKQQTFVIILFFV
jgi:hypothetical protein